MLSPSLGSQLFFRSPTGTCRNHFAQNMAVSVCAVLFWYGMYYKCGIGIEKQCASLRWTLLK